MAKQTLNQAVLLVRTGRGLRDVARCGLGGCPEGNWPETAQARRQMVEALPRRSERDYTVAELIERLYTVESGRYVSRDAEG